MSDYTAHLARDDNPLYTACGEPWQGWQAPSDLDLRDPHAITLAPHDPPTWESIRQCQACLRVAMEQAT